MEIEKVFNQIKQNLPRVIFVTGKTSTGKSTFAKKLQSELGYKVIELDQIVVRSVASKEPNEDINEIFLQVYRGGERKDWIDAFVKETKKEIEKYRDEKIVLNGALANNETLSRVFGGMDFLFIYFSPANKEKYIDMLTERFVAGAHDSTTGLPKHFWEKIDEGVFKKYLLTNEISQSLKEAISLYAQLSIEQSEERFKYFGNHFSGIIKTSI